jgi:tRNA U34 5-methylaminomethyl-2-thiouridine-forming methyltransferase MnmC
MNLAIRQTSDGSHTLCNLDMNETYHSIYGAVYESQHVFIKAGLERVLGKKSRVELLEIGFGTGLNALLTIQKVLEYKKQNKSCEIHYTSLEPYPIPMELVQQLNYAQYLEEPPLYKSLLIRMHEANWEKSQEILSDFYLTKHQTTLENFLNPVLTYDLIYFDAFSPSVQPNLWEKPMLFKLTQALALRGILTTYCAKGQFKRDMKDLGLGIERLPGPPGKSEMTRAFKPM